MNGQTADSALPPVTGLILAGGKGTRMAQQDKGLLKLAGKTLVEMKVESLAPQVDKLIISANRNLETYRALGYPVVTDSSSDYLGPLAGIAATWHVCQTDWLVTCPCDTPALSDDYVSRLQQACQNKNTLVAVAHDGERMQNTFLIMHRSVLPSITDMLAQQNYAVFKWLALQAVAQTDFADEQGIFTNFNTPEEFDNYANQ